MCLDLKFRKYGLPREGSPVAGLVFQARVSAEANFQSWQDYLEMVMERIDEAGG